MSEAHSLWKMKLISRPYALIMNIRKSLKHIDWINTVLIKVFECSLTYAFTISIYNSISDVWPRKIDIFNRKYFPLNQT